MIETAAINIEILSLIRDWEPRLTSLQNDTITHYRNSQNRTVKQILGHLIDSTSNNIHRIVHLQYQQSRLLFQTMLLMVIMTVGLQFQNYQNEDWNNMIQLWKYSLIHFCHVINNTGRQSLIMNGLQVRIKNYPENHDC